MPKIAVTLRKEIIYSKEFIVEVEDLENDDEIEAAVEKAENDYQDFDPDRWDYDDESVEGSYAYDARDWEPVGPCDNVLRPRMKIRLERLSSLEPVLVFEDFTILHIQYGEGGLTALATVTDGLDWMAYTAKDHTPGSLTFACKDYRMTILEGPEDILDLLKNWEPLKRR